MTVIIVELNLESLKLEKLFFDLKYHAEPKQPGALHYLPILEVDALEQAIESGAPIEEIEILERICKSRDLKGWPVLAKRVQQALAKSAAYKARLVASAIHKRNSD